MSEAAISMLCHRPSVWLSGITPLIFSMASLLRYPMVSRIHFLECSGNSQLMYQPTPPTLTCGQTHGLVS